MSKILIIEDDALVSRMYQQSFAFEGLEAVVAHNGLEGIEKAKTEKPDIIFCDIMMPKMNGLEVLDALKKDPLTNPIMVVMLTNMSGSQDSQSAMDKGAYAYIVKSEFKPKEIAQKAKEFLAYAARVEQSATAATPPLTAIQQSPTPVPTPATPAPAQPTAPVVTAAPTSTPAPKVSTPEPQASK